MTAALLPPTPPLWQALHPPPCGRYLAYEEEHERRRGEAQSAAERDKIMPKGPLLRCTQPAGMALFIPSGWDHATLNLETTVGGAVEVGDVTIITLAKHVW